MSKQQRRRWEPFRCCTAAVPLPVYALVRLSAFPPEDIVVFCRNLVPPQPGSAHFPRHICHPSLVTLRRPSDGSTNGCGADCGCCPKELARWICPDGLFVGEQPHHEVFCLLHTVYHENAPGQEMEPPKRERYLHLLLLGFEVDHKFYEAVKIPIPLVGGTDILWAAGYFRSQF